MIRMLLFFIVLSLAAVRDLKDRIIPDGLVILLMAVSVIPPGTIHPEGLLAALPLFVTGVMAGGIGGGDIKLTGACGLVLGFARTTAGLLVGLLALIGFHAVRSVIAGIADRSKSRMKYGTTGKGQAYPFVPFLLFGMCVCFLTGAW